MNSQNNLIEKGQGRFIELDALRGIAAMIVLTSHYIWAYAHYFNLLTKVKLYFKYGDWGVQFFFIISGFVIFMTLEKVRTVKEFAVARFFRLYPTYWTCMFLTLTCLYFFPVPNLGGYSLFTILKNISMLQGFMRTDHIDQVYWSLCVELAFYVIMALIFYFKKIKNIEVVCLVWLILSLIAIYFDFPFKKFIVVVLILKNAPLFIAGIMFYKIKKDRGTYWNHLIILSSLIIFSLTIFADRMQVEVDYIPFVLIIIAFSVFYFLMYKKCSFLRNPILLFLGSISYPLYLLHNVIGYSIIYRVRMFTDNIFAYTIIPAIFSIALAYLVSRYVEKPLIAFFKMKLSKVLNHTR